MTVFFMQRRYALALMLMFIVLLIPLSIWSQPFDFYQPVQDSTGQAITYLTYSAGKQGFLISLFLLMIWVTWRCQIPRHQWSQKALQLILLLGLAMVLKVGIKALTEQPRPYTEVMTQSLLLPNPQHFYLLSEPKQQAILLAMESNVSPWRVKHWQQELDYSFPSGHTLFAVVCLLFFGQLLAEKKRYLDVAVLLSWTISIGYSRLWLGMHYPLDLFGAGLLAGALYLLVPLNYALPHLDWPSWLPHRPRV
ncbi:MAG: phosphatase PAP2 family protein [Vibrio sp.]